MNSDVLEATIITILLVFGWIIISAAYYHLKRNQGIREVHYMSRYFLLGLMTSITVVGTLVIAAILI